MWEENLHTPDISILSYFTKQKGNHSASWHCCSEARYTDQTLFKGKAKARQKVRQVAIIPVRERRMKTIGCASVCRTRGDHSLPRATALQRGSGRPVPSVSRSSLTRSHRRPPPPRPTARPGLHSSPALARRTHSAPRADHPPARSQLGSAGAAPAARRPLAGCHVTLRGNQELRGAADGRGRGRGRDVRGG